MTRMTAFILDKSPIYLERAVKTFPKCLMRILYSNFASYDGL